MTYFRSFHARIAFVFVLMMAFLVAPFVLPQALAASISVTVNSDTVIPSQGLSGLVGGGWGGRFSATSSGAPTQGSECTATNGGPSGAWSGPSWTWTTQVTAGSGGTANGLAANDPDDGSPSSQVNLNYYSKGTYTVKVIAKVTYTSVCGNASGEGSKTISVKIVQPVSSVTVQTVTFGSSTSILKDQGTAFPSPHWQRGRAEQSPVSYKSSKGSYNFVQAGATFSISPQNADQPIQIKGMAGDNVFAPQSKTPSSGSASYNNTASNKELPAYITSGNPYNITWYYSTNSGSTWNICGSSISDATSSNALYTTLGAPTVSLYLTTLKLSSAANNGQSDPNIIVPNIWSQFTGLSVNRSTKTPSLLKYWAEGPASNSPDPLNPRTEISVRSVADLLSSNYASGQCEAWMNLLSQCAAAQGISMTNTIITRPSKVFFEGKNYDIRAMVVYSNLPGQGNSEPEYVFGNHAVIKWGAATIYDPSYGKSYSLSTMAASQKEWEDKSIIAYLSFDPSLGREVGVPDPKGVSNVTFSP